MGLLESLKKIFSSGGQSPQPSMGAKVEGEQPGEEAAVNKPEPSEANTPPNAEADSPSPVEEKKKNSWQ